MLYISSFKASSPESAISCFLFQYSVSCISLRSSSSYLSFPPHLRVTSILPFIFPSVTCSTRKILRNMWPIQLDFLLFIMCRIFLSSLSLWHISQFLTQSVQLILSILLQHHISKLPRYCWFTPQSIQVKHHTKLCFKCSTLLASSLNISLICC
jgi:hypothetical protein